MQRVPPVALSPAAWLVSPATHHLGGGDGDSAAGCGTARSRLDATASIQVEACCVCLCFGLPSCTAWACPASSATHQVHTCWTTRVQLW